jgi:hypothetical protein
MGHSLRTTAASATALAAGLGFGLPCIGGIWHLAATGEVWTFVGFPTYGDGPFERVGVHSTVPLLCGFLAVCLVEVALGALIQRRAARAPTLSALLLPIELAFWIGFALPFGPVLGLARLAARPPLRESTASPAPR